MVGQIDSSQARKVTLVAIAVAHFVVDRFDVELKKFLSGCFIVALMAHVDVDGLDVELDDFYCGGHVIAMMAIVIELLFE